MSNISKQNLRLKLITRYSVCNIIQADSYFAIIFPKYKTCGNTVSAVVKTMSNAMGYQLNKILKYTNWILFKMQALPQWHICFKGSLSSKIE